MAVRSGLPPYKFSGCRVVGMTSSWGEGVNGRRNVVRKWSELTGGGQIQANTYYCTYMISMLELSVSLSREARRGTSIWAGTFTQHWPVSVYGCWICGKSITSHFGKPTYTDTTWSSRFSYRIMKAGGMLSVVARYYLATLHRLCTQRL